MKFMFVLIAMIVLAANARRLPPPPPSSCGATYEVCGKFGNPRHECSQYGLKPLGKDDYNQRVASRSAAITLVKAGQCHTVYKCARAGTQLAAGSGKDISHVTYCGDYDDADCNDSCGSVPSPGAEAPEEPAATEEEAEAIEEAKDAEEDAVEVNTPAPTNPPSNPVVDDEAGGVIVEEPAAPIVNPFTPPPPVLCQPQEPAPKQVVLRVKDRCKHNYKRMRRRLRHLSTQASQMLHLFASEDWTGHDASCTEAKKNVDRPTKYKIESNAATGGVVIEKEASPASSEKSEVIENKAASASAAVPGKTAVADASPSGHKAPVSAPKVKVEVVERPVVAQEKSDGVGHVIGRVSSEEGFPLDGDDAYYKQRCLHEPSNPLACDPFARARAVQVIAAVDEAKRLGIKLEKTAANTGRVDHTYTGSFDLGASIRNSQGENIDIVQQLKEKKAEIARNAAAKEAAAKVAAAVASANN